MHIRWNLIKMWWMALIHKTEIWCSVLDIDIFRNCSFGCASSWFFLSFKLILYVCNLLSKWDGALHSTLFFFFFYFAPLSTWVKEKAMHQCVLLAVLLLSPSSSALAIASRALYTFFSLVYSLIRVFNSQRWWQWDRDSFCGLRCSHLIIIVESDPSKKNFHETKKKRRTKQRVFAKRKDTSKHCALRFRMHWIVFYDWSCIETMPIFFCLFVRHFIFFFVWIRTKYKIKVIWKWCELKIMIAGMLFPHNLLFQAIFLRRLRFVLMCVMLFTSLFSSKNKK